MTVIEAPPETPRETLPRPALSGPDSPSPIRPEPQPAPLAPVGKGRLARWRRRGRWLVLALLVVWAFTLRPQSFGGPAGYVMVRGTSMLPTFKTDDLVIARPADVYQKGDIVAFRIPNGEVGANVIVLHRIVGGSSRRGFILQGDNNAAPDLWRAKPRDIVGKAWIHVPHLARLLALLHAPVPLASLGMGVAVAMMMIPKKRNRVAEPEGEGCDDGGVVAQLSPITFAHRGARLEYPENTIAAFRGALEQGATGLETDARLSADGEVVLVHNAVIRRFPSRLRVESASSTRLAKFGVPQLRELYAELGSNYELSIDLKHPDVMDAVVDIAREAGAADRLWVCSGSAATLERHRAFGTDLHLVHSTRKDRIREPLERHAAALADAGVDAINLHHSDWTAGLLALYHRFGVQVFAWDVQEIRNLEAMLQIGVDALYCDNVGRMVTTVAAWTDARLLLEQGDVVERPDA